MSEWSTSGNSYICAIAGIGSELRLRGLWHTIERKQRGGENSKEFRNRKAGRGRGVGLSGKGRGGKESSN